jgi:hypothetical protein
LGGEKLGETKNWGGEKLGETKNWGGEKLGRRKTGEAKWKRLEV